MLEIQFILKGSSRRSEGSGLKKKAPLLTQWTVLVFSGRQGVRISYKWRKNWIVWKVQFRVQKKNLRTAGLHSKTYTGHTV